MLNRILAVVFFVGGLSPALAQGVDDVELNIEPQALSASLREVADSFDLTIAFYSESTDGLEGPALDGEYTSKAALDTLLADTDLEYTFINDSSVAVRPVASATDQGGDRDSKNLNSTLGLTAQNQTTETSSRSDERGTSLVTGKVTDARTGANLKGAKVTIEETGQWTSTNDLGEFRFVNVPTGLVTLTVSYLGFAHQSVVVGVRGASVSQNFALRGGNDMEEIVVFGQRSGRAIALNQERTAENSSTVLASDFLGDFTGTTISDALRRAPGVAFQRDSSTGDGTNVIVRGLAPDFNTVTLNGVRLPETSGEGRSADLSNILTESISKVTISKTLLPSQDSSGTGGLVDVETKGPLDCDRRFFSFGADVGRSDGDFLEDQSVSATVSGTFGASDNFGLSMSAQYREQRNESVFYSNSYNFGQYLPLAEDGSLIPSRGQIDPRTPFPFEPGVDEAYPSSINSSGTNVETENLALSFTAQWTIADHTSLKFDVTRSERDRAQFSGVSTFNSSTAYVRLPVDGVVGEERFVLVFEDAFLDSFGIGGAFVNSNQNYNFFGDEEETDVYSLEGTTKLGRMEFGYTLGHAQGSSRDPFGGSITVAPNTFDPMDLTFLLPEALNNTVDGKVVSLYAPRRPDDESFPLPLLTQEGFAFYNSPDNYNIRSGQIVTASGSNERTSGNFSVRYNFKNTFLKYIEVGLFLENSRFESLTESLTLFTGTGATLTDLGLNLSEDRLASVGGTGGINVLSQRDAISFVTGLDANPNFNVREIELDPRNKAAFTEEEELATYIQARVDIGKLEVIGGVRLSEVSVQAVNLTSPGFRDEFGQVDREFIERFSILINQQATQTSILPRFLANYRYTDNVIVRGGYFMSEARPRIDQLSADQRVSLDLVPMYGPEGNQPRLFIREGNPDLKPSRTHNFDLGVEYYDDNIGVMKLSVFYKNIENFLENNRSDGFVLLDGVILPDDSRFQNLPPNIFVVGNRPVNSDSPAEIWGLEAALEQQFTSLPGFWSGLGILANYTYSDSSKEELVSFSGVPDGQVVFSGEPFDGQPQHSGTVAVTYNKHGVDATLAYTAQSRRLSSFGNHNLSRYSEALDSLDLRAEYRFERFGGNFRVYLEGSDLLRDVDDPAITSSVGGTGNTPKYFTAGSFLGGRTAKIGITASF